jgi:uncharacterized protein
MRILISGGTGLIGRALVNQLLEENHQVWVLTRNPKQKHLPLGANLISWDGRSTTGWGELVSGMDAIVNLAGDTIGSWPWNAGKKKRIIQSRVFSGQALVQAIQKAKNRPKTFIQASAVGYYGLHADEEITENTPPGEGFLSEICKKWESSTEDVEKLGLRRVVIRTGIVLSKDGGILSQFMLPIKFYFGGPLGNGRQGIPWIHIKDEVGAISYLVKNGAARGIYNLSAPHPLSNRDFGRVLAKEMKRPFWAPVPAFLIRFIFGEMSDLLLQGHFMYPKRLLDSGYHFLFPDVKKALHNLLS